MVIQFILNDKMVVTNEPTSTTLLDFIRKSGLTGTKIGCREGDCGACTVLVGELIEERVIYKTYTSCLTPLININRTHIVTVEGLGKKPTVVQLEMVNAGATQCGFCTPGFVMSLTGAAINNSVALKDLDGNICRCTGYKSIVKAANNIQSAYMNLNSDIHKLVHDGFLPIYFTEIKERLEKIEQKDHQTEGTLIGGGTDLYVQKRRVLEKSNLRLVKRTRYINLEGGILHLGASTRMSDIINDKRVSSFLGEDQLRMIASTPIRNMATLAGNIVNASPIGDFSIILIALNATLKIKHENSERETQLDQFYNGYKKYDLKEGEEIISIHCPWNWDGFNFEKVSKRKMLDIASVNTAFAYRGNADKLIEIRISAGGVFENPLYLENTCKYLTGKAVKEGVIKEALAIMEEEISPISDVRGSKLYKTLLLRNLLIAHFLKHFPEAIRMEELL